MGRLFWERRRVFGRVGEYAAVERVGEEQGVMDMELGAKLDAELLILLWL